MKARLKNCLSRNRGVFLLLFCSFISLSGKAQIANYISNGSFEEMYECTSPYELRKLKSWMSTDSSASITGIFYSVCRGSIPLNGNTYQYPRSGDTYFGATFFCPSCGRGYLKNRLKAPLEAGKYYCVKFYVNISNSSPRGMNGFGIYFGDASIDTITKNNIPLTYLSPQVQNPPFSENIISDTLNWVEIKGSFMANGTEKYALIGNFLSDNATQTSPIMGPYYPQIWTDVLIDDVSCLEIDMPVFAGADTFFIPGSTLYLGRERDVGIDEACTWYQLPNMAAALDTAAGIWVTPVGTSTYVVRQEICGNVKWDTVVLRESPVGITKHSKLNTNNLKIWPLPAKDEMQLQLEGYNGNARLMIFNNLGVVMRDEELVFKENKVFVRISELEEGVYFLELRANELRLRHKLLIER